MKSVDSVRSASSAALAESLERTPRRPARTMIPIVPTTCTPARCAVSRRSKSSVIKMPCWWRASSIVAMSATLRVPIGRESRLAGRRILQRRRAVCPGPSGRRRISNATSCGTRIVGKIAKAEANPISSKWMRGPASATAMGSVTSRPGQVFVYSCLEALHLLALQHVADGGTNRLAAVSEPAVCNEFVDSGRQARRQFGGHCIHGLPWYSYVYIGFDGSPSNRWLP